MEDLLYFLEHGRTQFHVVKLAKEYLSKQGFKELSLKELSGSLPAGKYFVSPFSSMLIPFVKGNDMKHVRIASAHTDFPMMKIKVNPDIQKIGYRQLNVEPYGGIIKETWFDRPLGIAGKIICKGESIFSPVVHLYDSMIPICIIPNLAPHLKRGNKDGEIDVQKEMLPVVDMLFNPKRKADGSASDKENTSSETYLLRKIAEELLIDAEDILDYDLYLYIAEEPQTIGFEEMLVSSPRIDNISSVCAILKALTRTDCTKDILMVGALFDNEEIGSRSKQGADSGLLRDIIDKLTDGSSCNLTEDGFYLSVDVAHATHPNYTEKSDITNQIILGKGVAIKYSASQRYVCDSEAGAAIASLCKSNDILLQRTVNRSGMPGGQTLGPIMSSYLPMPACDIGIPVLAMHSARELMHASDYLQLVSLLSNFFVTGK